MTDGNTILARSFSRHEQRKLGCWAFAGILIIAMTIFIVFKPFLGSFLPISNLQRSMGGINLQRSMGGILDILMRTNETIETEKSYFEVKKVKPICDIKQPRSDICEMDGDIRVQGNLSTIFIVSSPNDLPEGNNQSWTIKPYARKFDSFAMKKVRTIGIREAQVSEGLPGCDRNYSIPAIVFSIGAYTGNYFHDFSDVLIPLYSTSIQFNGEVLFLIADKSSPWINKYQTVLKKLSKYELIEFDKENEVLCFPRIIVGLKASMKELAIDPSQSSYSIKDFREFLRSTYSLKRESLNYQRNGKEGKSPRLFIISRSKTRQLLNAGEIADMAESLGFEVATNEMDRNISMVSQRMSSVDILVGVHGAALTNMVFLPENAVVIQIIPLGARLMEGIARGDFEMPAKNMNLRYLAYRINPNESSLIHQYPYDHEIFKAPDAIFQKGWMHFRSIFLDKQDVKVDRRRFREVLLNALELVQG